MVKGEAHRRIQKQYGQTHAWHSVAAWHGHARDRRLFSPDAPAGFRLRMQAYARPPTRGQVDVRHSPPMPRRPLQREGDALCYRLIGF
jgi:hypothetical protein